MVALLAAALALPGEGGSSGMDAAPGIWMIAAGDFLSGRW